MIRKPITYKKQYVLGIVSIVIIACLYSYLSWRQHNINASDTTLPSIKEIFTKGTYKIFTPDSLGKIWIWEDGKATLSRLSIGLGIGVLLSFFVGLGMGNFSTIEGLFKWPITFISQIPATAMLAVFLVVSAMTNIPVVPMLVCFGVFPTLTQTIYLSAKQDVHEELIFKAYTLGASHAEVIWNIVVPQILPRILDAVRICIGPALVYLIAAEWSNEHIGFGYRLKIQGRQMHMAVVYNYLIILGCFGYFADMFMVRLRNYLCPWYVK